MIVERQSKLSALARSPSEKKESLRPFTPAVTIKKDQNALQLQVRFGVLREGRSFPTAE